jgi:two-component system, OmpR family, phosphate regulon response regulator PhoB
MTKEPASDAMPNTGDHVVVVEDEEDIRGLIAFTLREAGWATHCAATGAEGIGLVESVRPSMLVLDLMLPDMSGIEVCRRVRADAANRRLGIVVVTARGDEYDRILGFESGADDYVVKPFSVRELALRVRALARSTAERAATWSTGALYRWRGVVVDPMRHRVLADGVDLVLRPAEFKILLLLISSPERAFTRAEIIAAIDERAKDVSPRTIDTHVSRLRDALGPYAGAVETVPAVGYRLGPESPPR